MLILRSVCWFSLQRPLLLRRFFKISFTIFSLESFRLSLLPTTDLRLLDLSYVLILPGSLGPPIPQSSMISFEFSCSSFHGIWWCLVDFTIHSNTFKLLLLDLLFSKIILHCVLRYGYLYIRLFCVRDLSCFMLYIIK